MSVLRLVNSGLVTTGEETNDVLGRQSGIFENHQTGQRKISVEVTAKVFHCVSLSDPWSYKHLNTLNLIFYSIFGTNNIFFPNKIKIIIIFFFCNTRSQQVMTCITYFKIPYIHLIFSIFHPYHLITRRSFFNIC